MAWQSTLAQMKACGTRVAQTCAKASCRRWVVVDVDAMIHTHGPDYLLWDRRPPCALCGGKTHFMASPGPSTPYTPLTGGAVADKVRREFLHGFGFTTRDIRRIRAMAEAARPDRTPRPLDDLDVPYRVGCCPPALEARSTGRRLGEWDGMVLVFWTMNDAEAEVWGRKRRHGPKVVP